ncbi:MAG: glycoside hydrolase family 10 protein, partial [Cyanobacteria bacterium]|nr:glycoside hydrolase family 10 protein [Cyanobacteriota bacterium]MDW8203044.1 glycoside hydrolase family 10 protein [Cyanobacteriota bacterium SKYGB_h_bin112]
MNELRSRWHWLLLSIILLFMLGLLQQPMGYSQTSIPNRELRGVWLTNIDSDVLFSRSNLRRGL